MKAPVFAWGLLALAGACAKKTEPQPAPTPAQEANATAERVKAEIEAQTGRPVENIAVTINYVEPPEELFESMGVAGASWARRSTGARSMGIYQADGADPRFRKAVQRATSRYSFRPIRSTDFTVVCSGSDRAPTLKSSPTGVCSMKYVDAVLMFNSLRIRGDSGFVGLNVTRVPSGATRAEQTYYCVTILRIGMEWEAKRGERMVDWNRCRLPIR